jgi:hypothetical protein
VKERVVMDIQLWVIAVIFSGAIFYFARRMYLQVKGKKSSGCEKCGIVEEDKKTAIK